MLCLGFEHRATGWWAKSYSGRPLSSTTCILIWNNWISHHVADPKKLFFSLFQNLIKNFGKKVLLFAELSFSLDEWETRMHTGECWGRLDDGGGCCETAQIEKCPNSASSFTWLCGRKWLALASAKILPFSTSCSRDCLSWGRSRSLSLAAYAAWSWG